MLVRAEGMYFHDENGRALLDACSGLWCSNAGHGRKQIAEAISKAAHELDFAPTFQFAHPQAFELAQRIAALAPEGLDHVFFVNSGSEAADAALKIARAYWQKKGQGGRFRLIGREKAYHGVTFGGISVGGLANNRKLYGPLLPGTDDHLPLPYDRRHALHARRTGEGRRLCRRARRPGRAAWRGDDRRGDRRADVGLRRRVRAAEGLSQAPARGLRPAQHPSDLRRGDHGLRPPRRSVRRRTLRRRCRT